MKILDRRDIDKKRLLSCFVRLVGLFENLLLCWYFGATESGARSGNLLESGGGSSDGNTQVALFCLIFGRKDPKKTQEWWTFQGSIIHKQLVETMGSFDDEGCQKDVVKLRVAMVQTRFVFSCRRYVRKLKGWKVLGREGEGILFFFSSLRHSLSLTGLGTGRGRGLLAGR